MAHTRCMLDKQGKMRTLSRPGARTHTHTKYVILIAFPLQQWLLERASMSCYTYIICLVVINIVTLLMMMVAVVVVVVVVVVSVLILAWY